MGFGFCRVFFAFYGAGNELIGMVPSNPMHHLGETWTKSCTMFKNMLKSNPIKNGIEKNPLRNSDII